MVKNIFKKKVINIVKYPISRVLNLKAYTIKTKKSTPIVIGAQDVAHLPTDKKKKY